MIGDDYPPAIEDWDDAYANADHIPGAQDFIDGWQRDAGEFRTAVKCELDLPYADGERNRFDLFYPDGDPAGLFVFIHGGYWYRFDKSYWSHLAKGPLAEGFVVAMPSYTLCPHIAISDIVTEIAAAIESAAKRIAGPIILAGHSAGGHLAARQVCEGSHLQHDTIDRINEVIAISGVFDLRPLMKTRLNKTLRIDDRLGASESPVLLQPLNGAKITCVVGRSERPEFIRQNAALANIWTGLGARVKLLEISNKHHFDVIDFLNVRSRP